MCNLSADVVDILKPASGIKILLTVGNTLRNDDGVGPYISEKLKSQKNFLIISGEINPENFLDEIAAAKPAQIIIIDAADFGGAAGEAGIIENDQIPETSLSTHALSLRVIAKILEQDTSAPVKFLGIQPVSVEFGEKISEPVKKTANQIIEIIQKEF